MTHTRDLPRLGKRYALHPDVILCESGPRRDAVIVVENGRIAAICDAGSPDVPADTLRLTKRAIVPGFIDTHTHLGQAFGKAFVFGEPSQIWQRIWGPLEGSLTPDLMRTSAIWMMLEALRGGFTTIVNFSMAGAEHTAAVHEAAALTGIRLVSCTGASDLADYPQLTGKTPRLTTIENAVRAAERHLELCADRERITASLCCSGIQGATPQMISALASFCAAHGIVFQFHSNEHFPEVHYAMLRHNMRPIEVLAACGALARHVLLHHCTLLNERELALLAESGTAVSYNPVASLWKGDGIAPALAFTSRSIRFGLGTDSTRSDAFRLLDAAESCQRVAHGIPKLDFSCGAGWTWIDAATRGAADACGLGAVTGRLASGYRADFLVLDMDRPEVLPSFDFEWELVRLYGRNQIDAVVIDGRPVLVGGRASGFDQDAFLHEQLPNALAAVERSGAVRVHGPSTAHRKS